MRRTPGSEVLIETACSLLAEHYTAGPDSARIGAAFQSKLRVCSMVFREDELNAPDPSRRWTVISSGLLIASMAVVVIYTNRGAFFSPITLVVVAAIGLVAVLLQLRYRRDVAQKVQLTMWLNIVGVLVALVSLFADLLRLSWMVFHVTALLAVGCFSVSSVVILEALRRNRVASR